MVMQVVVVVQVYQVFDCDVDFMVQIVFYDVFVDFGVQVFDFWF